MKVRFWLLVILIGVPLILWLAPGPKETIDYKASLTGVNGPVTGSGEFQLRLFNSASSGKQIGPTVSVFPVSITNRGLAALVNFRAILPDASHGWLEIGFCTNSGSGQYGVLGPRQKIQREGYNILGRFVSFEALGRKIACMSIFLALVSIVWGFKLRDDCSDGARLTKYVMIAGWVMVPPVYFWVDWVFWRGSEDLEVLKHTHDLARNIWIALVVLLSVILKVKLAPTTPSETG